MRADEASAAGASPQGSFSCRCAAIHLQPPPYGIARRRRRANAVRHYGVGIKRLVSVVCVGQGLGPTVFWYKRVLTPVPWV